MNILQKISRMLTQPQSNPFYDLEVQCLRCKEILTARIDLRNDLSPEYENSDTPSSYYCRKVIIGNQMCFQQIELILKFDAQRRLIDKTISGGKFLDEEVAPKDMGK
ncbi:MAG: hypothetical protein JW726_15165 [Anaerolineales bacterium]|nr:hypothetical protein [Anaerolineales bacterium]